MHSRNKHHEPISYLQNVNTKYKYKYKISSQEPPQLWSARPEPTSETSLPTRSAPASDPWPAWGCVSTFPHNHHHQALQNFSWHNKVAIHTVKAPLPSNNHHHAEEDDDDITIMMITIFIIIFFRKEVKRIQLARNDEQCYRYQSLAILPLWNI